MHLSWLDLTNYRNLRRISVRLGEGPHLIVGRNAQGKSNLLEAVELLATTKAARASSDRDLVSWERLKEDSIGDPERFARVSAGVVRDGRETRADVVVHPAENAAQNGAATMAKAFRLNGTVKRASEFVGLVNVVAFSPESVAMVSGAPSLRRRHLDVINVQVSRTYLRALQRYHRILVQRNRLLRLLREDGRHADSLSVWSDELIQCGSQIVADRLQYVAELRGPLSHWFSDIGGWGHLGIDYRSSLAHGVGVGSEEVCAERDAIASVADQFRAALESARVRERAAGVSLVGPHRDDLTFQLDGVDLGIYGSRGQQRLAILSLKLAEIEWLTGRVGSRPILLLDDVLSELDSGRQRAVLKAAAAEGQTLLTTTDIDAPARRLLPGATILSLEGGVVTELGICS